MIEIDGKKYCTEKQWAKKKRAILKRQLEKGVYRDWYYGSAMFYCEEQTRPYNKKELAKLKRERKLEKAEEERRKKAEEERKIWIENNRRRTSWQWLEYERRIPKDSAEPLAAYPTWFDGNVSRTSTKAWNYYKKEDTYEIDESIYNILKDKYIEKFGGWDYIDLEHTEYNGKKWW